MHAIDPLAILALYSITQNCSTLTHTCTQASLMHNMTIGILGPIE